ncbi:MAG: PQQ-dependent sugar dehydrogenase, partial [Rhodothermales bacterium]|nr:PQQ-dependent sugar dehydrogenase [Rhodothermales bacterium]
VLRVDVDSRSGNLGYGIPSDNPFVGNQQGFREEIYAYGLRNPWRFSFDADNGALWTGDVGQNRFEEIHIVESGKNYGWNVTEGFECFGSGGCDTSGLESPVHAYPHEAGNSSVTGGFVYRGNRLTDLVGSYIYADYVSGRIWSLSRTADGYANELLVDAPVSISSFGVDDSNNLFICAFDGRIYRLIETAEPPSGNPTGSVGIRLDTTNAPPLSLAVGVVYAN